MAKPIIKLLEEVKQMEQEEKNTNTNTIGIDKGVAIPTGKTGGGKSKYPWSTMELNDSFYVAGAKVETFYTLCSSASKKHGGKFICKKWQENGTSGVRVWKSE